MKKPILIGLLAGVLVLAVGSLAIASNAFKLQFISGTEYMMNENGQTIVRTVNQLGIPTPATACNITIYYPNKTIWIDSQAMTQGGTTGSWYYDWTAPNVTGVYEEYALCLVQNKLVGAGSSFHVSQPLTELYDASQSPRAVIIS